MTETALESDLLLLLFEREQLPCENAYHADRPHNHSGPAEWYVQLIHECGKNYVRAYCDQYTQYIIAHPDNDSHCTACDTTMPISEFFKVLGRIE